jgi:hypothetical protein
MPEIYDRIDAVGEAAADLLVNTEDNAMTGRIDKPCPPEYRERRTSI